MRIRSIQKNKGISLIEVLVSLLVLSIGLLGIAGLQVTALKNTREANTKTKAIVLAQDIIDSMRTNRVHILANGGGAIGGSYALALGSSLSAPGTLCDAVICTANELALFDQFNWWNQIDPRGTESTFANGSAGIDVVAGNVAANGSNLSALVTVQIRWTEVVNKVSTPMTYQLVTLM